MNAARMPRGISLPVPWWQLLLAVLVGIVIVVMAAPPAGWADLAVSRATGGRLRLAQAEGTLWTGRGRVVLADPSATGIGPRALDGVAIPGTLQWRLSALPLLVGMLDAVVTIDGMREPLKLSGSLGEMRGSAGALAMPAVRLDRMGSPWNTVQPTGALTLAWEPFTVRRTGFEGRATIELRDVASALSPVKPLGAYRVQIDGTAGRATVVMSTLVGPLQLDGNGTWTPAQGLRFTGSAIAEPPQRPQLAPLLGLVGRRDGERTIIRIGA